MQLWQTSHPIKPQDRTGLQVYSSKLVGRLSNLIYIAYVRSYGIGVMGRISEYSEFNDVFIMLILKVNSP
jgi:hypothetical protein